MKYASNERILLEVEILRLCSTWADTDLTALAARLAGLERKVAEGVTVTVTEQVSDGAVKKEKPKATRTAGGQGKFTERMAFAPQ